MRRLFIIGAGCSNVKNLEGYLFTPVGWGVRIDRCLCGRQLVSGIMRRYVSHAKIVVYCTCCIRLAFVFLPWIAAVQPHESPDIYR